jgi:hypothetical protein
MKTPVINTDDYTVYFEYVFDRTFIHCDCHRWSKTVKQQLKADFDKLVSIHRKPIFAVHDIDDIKHLKFISMMGFEYLFDFPLDSGEMKQLFVRIK